METLYYFLNPVKCQSSLFNIMHPDINPLFGMGFSLYDPKGMRSISTRIIDFGNSNPQQLFNSISAQNECFKFYF